MPDAASITAISALIAAIATAGITYMTTRNRARADEVSMLRDEVSRLHRQMREQKDEWESERRQMREEFDAERVEMRGEIADLKREVSRQNSEIARRDRVLSRHGIDMKREMGEQR